MLHYCKKCGRVLSNPEECICDICHSKIYPVPERYWLDGLDFSISAQQKQLLRQELVETSDEFDPELYANRDIIRRRNSAEVERVLSGIDFSGKGNGVSRSNVLRCPTCNSTKIRGIGGGERVASVAMLGLFSKKINKSFQCLSCGYTW